MVMLEKQDFLIQRDNDGKLLPVTVELEDGSGTVKMLPLTKGDISTLQATGKLDKIDTEVQSEVAAEVIAAHLVDPVFTKEQLMNDVQVLKFGQLVRALVRVSGLKTQKKF